MTKFITIAEYSYMTGEGKFTVVKHGDDIELRPIIFADDSKLCKSSPCGWCGRLVRMIQNRTTYSLKR